MTDQEKKSSASAAGGSSVVMVEQTTASRHKSYRPTGLQNEALVEQHHKRSHAPAVPSVAEELKHSAEDATSKEQKESEHAISSEKNKQTVAKNLSSATKRPTTSPETMVLSPLELEIQKADIIPPTTQPIPGLVDPGATDISNITEKKGIKEEDDSITEEIAQMRSPAHSSHREWSDEEAGGLPRSESRGTRGSRVSRVVRQLFCCGVPYDASSEHNVSNSRGGGFSEGI